MSHIHRWQSLVLPIAVLACVLVLIVPLPAALLDVLLAANIAVALIILLTTLTTAKPMDFSVFPTLLLTTTLARLVLNVASTRLILTQAPTQNLDAAGQVIRAFGEFVAGDHTVVGLVIFAIIIVIQFVVITKGSGRISEVAARFALDGMPGRQMAIDADLSAGLIDNARAQQLRQELTGQADFYGAMDGASKFVRGDALAGIVITAINIVGGLAIGVLDGGMSIIQATSVFTRLTIGDGLVSQTPALLISLAAGLLVTRSSQAVDLPNELLRQLFSRPQVLVVAAVFLSLLVFTQLPAVPLLAIAAGCMGVAFVVARRANIRTEQEEAESAKAATPPPREKRLEDFLAVDPMELEIGLGLVRLADARRGGDLLGQITEVRRRLAIELGLLLPKVRVHDNIRLQDLDYRIRIAGNPVADGSLHPDRVLALSGPETVGQLAGETTRDPATRRAAVWIDADQAGAAKRRGYTIIEPAAVLAGHLRRVVRDHAAELLTRDATKYLIDQLARTSPAVVEELIPDLMKVGEVQRVLQRLLCEDVPIRQLGVILEALGDGAAQTRDAVLLTEQVRCRLARTICTRYRDAQRRLRVVTLDPDLEERIAADLAFAGETGPGRMSLATREDICREIENEVESLQLAGHPPVLLVNPEIRAGLKELTASRLPELVVLSYDEITPDTHVESARMAGESAAAA